jgi:hypothetical protein
MSLRNSLQAPSSKQREKRQPTIDDVMPGRTWDAYCDQAYHPHAK